MKWLFIMLIHSITCVFRTDGNTRLDLNGKWQVSNSNDKYIISGDVPGGIYTALINNKIIGDPYYRDNDVKYRWIALDNWTYNKNFEVNRNVLSGEKVMLIAEGLDTFATITINGQQVGRSENMFVAYTWDISNIIQQKGIYSIRVEFTSPVSVASALANTSTYPLPDVPPAVFNGIPHVNFIRKMQYAFAWDWAPAFPSQGIWKDIYVQIIKTPIIQTITILPHKVNGGWSVDIQVNFETSNGHVDGLIEFLFAGNGSTILKERLSGRLSTSTSKQINHTMKIPPDFKVDVWWPNGYGNQSLYNLTVMFFPNTTTYTTAKWKRFGFRTVELVQDPVSYNISQGLTYYYRINDVPIFLKGSNWIPSDMFLERITPERTRRFLQSAAEVHINAMRMNGVGIYEEDYFYDLVDELGIMIVQDFMYSDALYPTTPTFLDSVKTEIKQQMQRIKHHPSIISWALNNENEELITQNWNNLSKLEVYKKDYVTLYIDTIRPIMLAEDDTRPWLPSSPSNGILVEKAQGWLADSSIEIYGDIHFYDYKSDLWDVKSYRIPRFSAEYGLQAWCNFETIERVFDEEDFNYWSNMSLHRQHHPQGPQEMINEASVHMKMPNSPDSKKRFKDTIYVTQIEQAVGIQRQTEHYRRYQNHLDKDGRGLTMGALYWQLLDVWQAPTWASIDYDLNWKMLHYYARHFLNPNLISPYIDGDTFNIYIVNDEIPTTESRNPVTKQLEFRPMTPAEVYNKYPQNQYEEMMKKIKLAVQGTVIMEIYKWNSFTPLNTWTIPYKLSTTSGSILEKKVDHILTEGGCTDKKECFLYFYLNSKINPTSTSSLPMAYFTQTQGGIPKASIQIKEVESISQTQFGLTLATNNPAPFVWINAYNISGRFSDNGFLMKDPVIQLTFTSWQPVDFDTFKQSLTVKSLMDIYE